MDDQTSAILDAFKATARPMMRRFMEAQACISAARTTMLTLDLFLIESRVLPVSFVFQAPESRYARVVGFNPEERAQMRKDAASWRDLSPEGSPGWNGHLIVIARNRWLIDPSVDQMASEEFGVTIAPEPLVIDIDTQERIRPPFEANLDVVLDDGQKATLTYRSIRDRSYRQTEAWTDEGLPFLAQQIARRMVEKLR